MKISSVLGFKSRRILFNTSTVKRQLRRHPDLTLSDYRALPKLFEKGLIIRKGSSTYVFAHLGGDIYRATLATASAGKKVNITDFQKTTQVDIDQLRTSGEVLREEL